MKKIWEHQFRTLAESGGNDSASSWNLVNRTKAKYHVSSKWCVFWESGMLLHLRYTSQFPGVSIASFSWEWGEIALFESGSRWYDVAYYKHFYSEAFLNCFTVSACNIYYQHFYFVFNFLKPTQDILVQPKQSVLKLDLVKILRETVNLSFFM